MAWSDRVFPPDSADSATCSRAPRRAWYAEPPDWSAAADIEALIQHVPGGLETYRPQMRYLTLDEKALLEQDSPAELRNLVHALFRLEHSRDPLDSNWMAETPDEPADPRLRPGLQEPDRRLPP
ncbi:hypothetical protein [Halorhodospira halophila]|uniref:hypothetical protein n=1 Tax=Halorhodospira halophila TaxID=1053 RepID=UPI001912D589|nr:hypothetical protein [Halorhodospira halophila]